MEKSDQYQAAVDRIARMDFAGVSTAQIAAACNLSEGRIEEVQKSEAYKTSLALIASEAFDKVDVLDGGWDVVENLAMNKVVEHLQHSPDPDYSLKAAAFANKAVRRGRHVNQPIAVIPGQQAIVNVSVAFADKLQQNFTVNKQPTTLIAKKQNNFLPPKAVTELLSKKTMVEKLSDDIGNLGMLSPA